MNWWNKISNIGINENIGIADVRRAKLTNRLIFFAIITEFLNIPVVISIGNLASLPILIVMLVLSFFFLLISYKGNHKLAATLNSFILISGIFVVSIYIPKSYNHSSFGFVIRKFICSGLQIQNS